MFDKDKKIIYSGIQPSGEFTIGNYFGAIKNWVALQHEYNCIYNLADLHTITVPQEPAALRRRTVECMAMLIASGINPENSLIFLQSHVAAHSQLCWLLNCFTYMGELSRMTQFKDKSSRQGANIRVGLYDYPVLMAADILLYQSDIVPVGDDQRQHLELARDIAIRFNAQYSPTFKVPEGYFGEKGARIMSLADPNKKMSKSDENKNAFILMKDNKDVIISKFKKAVTDCDSEIRYDIKQKPGISNLLEIYSCSRSISIKEAEADFCGKSYAQFKLAVGESVADALAPIQSEFERLVKEKSYINSIFCSHAQTASNIAARTLSKTMRKIGFYQLEKQ